MATSAELNVLTLKQLGVIGKELGIPGWHEMKKDDLVRTLVAKSRGKVAGETISQLLASPPPKPSAAAKNAPKDVAAKDTPKDAVSKETDPAKKQDGETRKRVKGKPRVEAVQIPASTHPGKTNSDRDISNNDVKESKSDHLILLVRDPYWLHAYWEISPRSMERAKAALGHRWYTSMPVLRLFRLENDGSGAPKRQLVKDIHIHGGVSNWYIDVRNPPSRFFVELGYLTRERNFYTTIASNEVETPQEQVIDELNKLDGNWQSIEDDLVRVVKISSGDGANQELKDVIEAKLGRPLTSQLLARYQVAKQGGSGALDKPRRNFKFEVETDVIIRGKTDPHVQVTIRNEPVEIKQDGTFQVRFAFPDKRHMFPIEAAGSDGVEKQTVILTIERNTRTLETVIQEPSDDD